MDYSLSLVYEEEKVIRSCINGDAWAMRLIYEEFYATMLPICMRYANNDDDARDIVHEGFIKVFKNISKYKVGTSLQAWIKRIMVNASIDYYRRESRKRTTDLDVAYDLRSCDEDALGKLNVEEIIKALQQLSPIYRSVFNLYVVEGYSHKEVSEILGISESTSRSNLVKARIKLRVILSAFMEGGQFPNRFADPNEECDEGF